MKCEYLKWHPNRTDFLVFICTKNGLNKLDFYISFFSFFFNILNICSWGFFANIVTLESAVLFAQQTFLQIAEYHFFFQRDFHWRCIDIEFQMSQAAVLYTLFVKQSQFLFLNISCTFFYFPNVQFTVTLGPIRRQSWGSMNQTVQVVFVVWPRVEWENDWLPMNKWR